MAPISGTQWWRASDYEVVGGTHIAPVEGAEIEVYDPFDEHEKYWGGKSAYEDVPPYLELQRMDGWFSSDGFNPDSLLEWCRRWGLLGILPHRTLETFFWPRWKRGTVYGGGGVAVGALGGGAMGALLPAQTIYRRGRDPSVSKMEIYNRPDVEEGAPLSGDDIRKARGRAAPYQVAPVEWPRVLCIRPSDGAYERRTLVAGYASFFPRTAGVLDWWASRGSDFRLPTQARSIMGPEEASQLEEDLAQEQYPIPFSDEFQREYGEPIAVIRSYVRQLSTTLAFWEDLKSPESREWVHEHLSRYGQSTPEAIPAGFKAGLDPISPSTRLDTDESGGLVWKHTWQSPSLYASLNVMVLQDLPLGEAELRRCQSEPCTNVLATTQYNREYCSKRCRKRNEMRAYRAED